MLTEFNFTSKSTDMTNFTLRYRGHLKREVRQQAISP